ncbi:hypothetical protein CG747_20900 [Streptomyces sp. CB02959]|uniref:hypothetical protein n=1 Tax=Streptomyces sp. CB02959 TaxID=2020330 RepID=UPI000C277042|nr:hypothetical protein [Streptomyces sp. CB02959]PJN39001.1 hypothetical protein CG747_20900 [Streptomyces sp. CB02959]
MLADEYGYQVSSQPAAQYFPPGRMEWMRHEQRVWRGASWVAGLLAVVGVTVLLTVWIPGGLATPGWAVMLCTGALCSVPLAWGIASTAYARSEPIVNVAQEHPFQSWPCQLEQTGSGDRLLLLLRPDGGVARVLSSAVPDGVWHSMADGRGVLWIAGDLRLGCVAATPGAEQVWAASGVPYGFDASRPGAGPVEDELLRAVTHEVFDDWLS